METLGDLSVFPKDIFLLIIRENFSVPTIFPLILTNRYCHKLIMNEYLIWKTFYERFFAELDHYEHPPVTDETKWKELVKESYLFSRWAWNSKYRDQHHTIISHRGFGMRSTKNGSWMPCQIGGILPPKGVINIKLKQTGEKNYLFPGVSEYDKINWTEYTLPTSGNYPLNFEIINVRIDCSKRKIHFNPSPPPLPDEPAYSSNFDSLDPKKCVFICSFLPTNPVLICPKTYPDGPPDDYVIYSKSLEQKKDDDKKDDDKKDDDKKEGTFGKVMKYFQLK